MSGGSVDEDLEAMFMGATTSRSHAVNKHREHLRKLEQEKRVQKEARLQYSYCKLEKVLKFRFSCVENGERYERT